MKDSRIFSFFISDTIGYEPKSQEIFQSWINKQNRESSVVELKSLNNPYEATDPNIEFYLLLPPLSKVILTNSIEEVIGSIKRAKENPKVQQVFQWVTLKNIQHPFVVQFVAHLADIILTFENEGHLNILTKKGGGSVSRKRYQYQIDEQTKTFNVKEVQLSKLKKQEDKPAINPHSLTTFKIGNLSVEEQKARDQVMLPYDK